MAPWCCGTLTKPAGRWPSSRCIAYVAVRGTERVEMRDFHALDEIDLPDWSLAVPDPGFADMLGHLDGNAWRLSELVARWALQVGPAHAGKALVAALPQDPPSQH